MFSEELEQISWEETTRQIDSKTDADVRRALAKEHCDVDDFMALISPAAAPYLETMYAQGILTGSDGRLEPNGPMTRGQACKVLYMMW